MKKILSCFLMLILLLGIFSSLSASAEQAPLHVSYINPLHAGEISIGDLEQAVPAEDVEAATRHTTISAAAADMRAQLKQRKSPIVLNLSISYELTQGMLEQIAREAFAHTGVPTEGDYLDYQYAGWNASTNGYYYGSSYTYTITYTVSYYTTAQQEQQVTAKVQSLISSLKLSGLTTAQKIQKIYDYICSNVSYDYSGSSSLQYTAYGALFNGKAVCQGYSVLLYRMLLECGIDCRVISGTSTANGSPQNHAWNIVKIGKVYYNADATWDSALNTRAYYLRCNANFAAHTRDSAFNNAQFNAAYPMSPTDYNSSPGDTGTTVGGFTDVSSKAYYANAVAWAVDKGIAKGMTSTAFWPDADCTRGQIVTFLWRAKGSQNPKSTYNPFADVASTAYYYKPVLWAVEKGITNGMTATGFWPDYSCTRGQAVTFLWRAENKPTSFTTSNPFTDVKPGTYYYYAVLWASSKGITNGMTATGFWPDYNCTRAQIVTFLYRLYG